MSVSADNELLARPLVESDEERAIREAVRGLCAPFDGDRDASGALWEALAAGGFVGAGAPVEWGGGGLGVAALAAIMEEVAEAVGYMPALLVVSAAIAGPILARHGTDEQRERWLRGVAAGTTKLAFALTEPDAGTNTHALRTVLRRTDGGYVLSGQKTFISAVDEADAILVVARVAEPGGDLGAPALCVVETAAAGVRRDAIPMADVGPERQWQLFFDDVAVDDDSLIGNPRGGLAQVFAGLNPERIIAAAGCCGLARRALDRASRYAREREVWGAPIATHQGVAHPLAKAHIELELARLMTRQAAALHDAGDGGAGAAATIAKYAAAEAAIASVDAAIQTHGGNGLALEYGLTDLWWGVRLARIAPVSREMVLNHVAQHALRLPRSY